MVLIKYALPIILVLLYALQDTILPPMKVLILWTTSNCQSIDIVPDATINLLPESLRYLSMYDNRCLRYFKGHKER